MTNQVLQLQSRLIHPSETLEEIAGKNLESGMRVHLDVECMSDT